MTITNPAAPIIKEIAAMTEAALAPYERVVRLSRAIRDATGKEVRELVFREPTVADLIASEKLPGNAAKIAAIIARQNNLTLPVVETMPSRDFQKCDAAIGELMGNDSDEDGGTPPS